MNIIFRQVTLTFKKWKGRPTNYIFMTEGDDIMPQIKECLRDLQTIPIWKRRALESVTVEMKVKL